MERPFPAYKGDEPYIFVSYAHADAELVYPELIWLKEQGCNIWYDEGISPGTQWRDELANAIRSADLFLYLVTPQAVQSNNCRQEVNYALDADKPILAIHLKSTELPEGLKLSLSDRQAIFKHELTDQEYRDKVLSGVRGYIQQGQSAIPVAKATGPDHKTKPVLIGAGLGDSPPGSSDVVSTGETEESVEISLGGKLVALRSIAVLPFTNMSTNEETGFVAKGLSEDILDRLAKRENLNVTSRSASFQFSEEGQDLGLVAQSLNVAYLLEGSVRQRGDSIRITAQLIRAKDGFHVWSKTYDRNLADGFDVQEQVAHHVAHLAQEALFFDVIQQHVFEFEDYKDINPAAVEHHREAMKQYQGIRLGEGGSWTLRVQHLKQATEIDPSFYLAFSSLANTYMQQQMFGYLSLQEAMPAAHSAINRAIALRPDSLGIQMHLGMIYLFLDWDYAKAEEILRRGLPNFYAYSGLSSIEMREGRIREALELIAPVPAMVPDSQKALYLDAHAWLLIVAGDYEHALIPLEEALDLVAAGGDRALALYLKSSALSQLGQDNKAVTEELWQLDGGQHRAQWIDSFLGGERRQEAIEVLNDPRYQWNNANSAFAYIFLEQIDNAFSEIEKGIKNHDNAIAVSLRIADFWDPLRDDPRFDEMLELLDSETTHTERYLRDDDVEPVDR